MNGLSARYLEIQPRELVRYLLQAAGQCERECANPAEILDLLGLQYASFDFELELPKDARETVCGAKPRALISFNDRLVATDTSISDKQTRFSVLHEIGHFVLPNHQHTLYICDDQGLSLATRLVLEKEASEFAADLLFLGDRFSLDANSHPISALMVKELATKYRASFEATARRMVEKSFQPCMLVVFKEEPTRARIDVTQVPTWASKYCIASPRFKSQYFGHLRGNVSPQVAAEVTRPGSDIADSVVVGVSVAAPREQMLSFRAEFFSNKWSIFCLLTPDSQSK
jgi:hypothetical protein